MTMRNAFEDMATAARQDAAHATIVAIQEGVGAADDAPAPDDPSSGSWGFVSLLKKLLLASVALRDRFAVSTSNGILIGTTRDKFRDTFATLDTVSNWTVVQSGGMAYAPAGVSAGSRYLNVNSGVTSGAEFVLQSKDVFRPPFRVRFALTTSQAIANQEFHVELVEVDASGNVVVDTSIEAGASFNGARNGAGFIASGASQNYGAIKTRADGAPEYAAAAGTIVSAYRTATGTAPNYLAPCQIEMALLAEMFMVNVRAANSSGAASYSAARNDTVPNPEKDYAIRVRVKNTGVPASATDFRLHYVQVLDASRVSVDFGTIGGTTADANAVPVKVLNGTTAVTQSSRGSQGAGWYVAPDNVLVADVASAAITATTTTATITPTPAGAAAEFNVVVTAVSGTNPTLDVVVQESVDNGTNWHDVYHFQRITAAGVYRSPIVPILGTRLRYVQTVGGTSPSFTRSINRITHDFSSAPMFRQIIDRAIALGTLNSTSSRLSTLGAKNVQCVVSTTSHTSNLVLTLYGSEDGGTTWYALGATVSLASSTSASSAQVTVLDTQCDLVMAKVTDHGGTVVGGAVLLKTFG